MQEDRTSFPELLRELRYGAALSQEDLADRTGISRRGISDLERGLRHAPRLETVRLLADGLALGDDERQALFAAARPALLRSGLAATPASLPSLRTPLTRLIGRETELAELRTALADDEIRLLTLTGPGGVGKTRLAIEVASGLHGIFPNGVVFVDLSPLTNPDLVVPTIAAALGIRESARRRLIETLATVLTSNQVLLVLDNCERVLDAAPDITRLLAASPRLTVFATSREPFHVPGERQFPLLPLPLPASDRLSMFDELTQIPAITLFIERATAVQPAFALTEDTAAVVAICQRLDGLPLAIELAAAQIKVLPPAALLTRLEQRLPVLIGGARDLPTRQRTMRDAVAWSYDLLRKEERILFRQLAIFVGGWTLEAAEAVTSLDGQRDVLDGTASLVDKSLVRETTLAGDAARFGMLETIREFALEQLVRTGEDAVVRAAHTAYFRGLGHDAYRDYLLRPTALWRRLAPETDNLRNALAWASQHQEHETGLWLAHTLAVLARGQGSLTEARGWVEHFLAADASVPSIPLARALCDAGRLALFQNDLATAALMATRLAAIVDDLQDEYAEDSSRGLSLTLALFQDDLPTARRLAEDALVASQRTDLPLHLALLGLEDAAKVAYADGNFDRAATLWQELLTRLPPDVDPSVRAGNFAFLADATLQRGRVDEAVGWWGEALELLRGQEEDTWNIPLVGQVAQLAQRIGRPDLAVRLLAAASPRRQSTGLADQLPGQVAEEARVMAQAREALGEESFAAAWADGAGTSLTTLFDEVRRVLAARDQQGVVLTDPA